MIAVRPGTLAWKVLDLVVWAPGELTSKSIAAELLPWRRPPMFFAPPPGPVPEAWARLGLEPLLRCRIPADELQRHEEAFVIRAEARVADLMRRLQERGLVERRRAVVACSAWFEALVARAGGVAAALEYTRTGPACLTDAWPRGAWVGGDVVLAGDDSAETFLEQDELEEDEPEASEEQSSSSLPDELDEHGVDEVDELEPVGRASSTPSSPPAARPQEPWALQLLEACLERPRSPTELLGPAPSGALLRAYAQLGELGALHLPSHRWPTPAGVALITARFRPASPSSRPSPGATTSSSRWTRPRDASAEPSPAAELAASRRREVADEGLVRMMVSPPSR